jgi:hypothetical protein
VLSLSEPWGIIEFTVLFVAAVIVALKEYGEKLPEIITDRVSPFFKSRRWAAVPLLLIGVFVLLLFLQLLGTLPKDRGEIPHSSSPASGFAPAPQSDDNARQIVELRSELSSRQTELDQTKQQFIAAQQHIESLESDLEAQKKDLNNEKQARMSAEQRASSAGLPDMTSASNILVAAQGLVTELESSDKYVLITAAPQNTDLGLYLRNVFGMSAMRSNKNVTHNIFVQLPNYKTDLDAPKFDSSDYAGISIHGEPKDISKDAAVRNIILDLFGRMHICATDIGWTQKSLSQLSQYYKRNIIWIEIGAGALLKQARERC